MQTADCGLQTVPLKKSLKNLYLDHFKPVFLIFDQFEELFIFGSKQEKEEFVKSVKTVVESDLQVRFMFVIREEYLAGITEFERQIPQILSNRVRIEKMTRVNAQQAIEGPCKYSGIEVEQGFAEQLLDKLTPEGVDVELTYLQVFLDKIFKLSQKGNPEQTLKFNLELLQQTGDVKDLLGSFLEEQIAQLADPDTALVVLKAFVSSKGTKRQVTEDDVLDYSRTLGKNISIESLRELILRFVSLRILRDKDESGRYELRHDALAAKIFEKITVFEKDLLEIRQFIENAYANYEKRKILLSVADLKYFGQYEDKIFLGGALLDFVNISKDDIRKKQKVLNRITQLSAFFLLVIFALVIIYFLKQADINSSKDICLHSISDESDPAASLENAMNADSINSTMYTKKAIFNAFYKLWESKKMESGSDPMKKIFDFTPCQNAIIEASFSEDGKYIYACIADSGLAIWKSNGQVFKQFKTPRQAVYSKLSMDSKYIAIFTTDSYVEVYNINGKMIIECKVKIDTINIRDVFSFKSSKNLIAIINFKGCVDIYTIQQTG